MGEKRNGNGEVKTKSNKRQTTNPLEVKGTIGLNTVPLVFSLVF